jgi:guanosine-3',5'-bis(diphosphate) 3'-pyrophosphohydrolase
MELTSTERAARTYAELAHGDQKYGDKPYHTHLRAVREVLVEFGYTDDDHLAAAWLHDVLEDTATSSAQLESIFGPAVTGLVYAVTGVGKNRKERNATAFARMVTHPGAIILKLADRIANAEACAKGHDHRLEMYRKEHPGFKAKLAPLCDALNDPQVPLMWERLDKVLG